MELSGVQLIAIFIVSAIAGMGSVLDEFQTHRPLIACTLVGAILGIIYVLVGYVIYYLLPSFNIYLSAHLIGFILLFCNIFLTGALHCDGFTDTMDGILSGRKRERILEIMKDSRVGAHGAT